MDTRDEQELDRALGRLASAEERLRPVPGDDLIARVLADAAEVSAARRPAPARKPAGRGGFWSWAAPRAEAWIAGATVALAACLMVGFLVGYAVDGPEAILGAGGVASAEFEDGMVLADASGMFGPDAPF